MIKTRSILMLLVLGTALAACGSDPPEPANTNPPSDQLSAILSTPGPAKTCITEFPPPTAVQATTADDPCPDSGSACGNTFPLVWCKVAGTAALVQCEKGAWVIKVKMCP
jgi:hypothetical protein